MRFSRQHRLVLKKDFERVFAEACIIRHKYIKAYYRSNTLGHPRLGIVVGKRYLKKAIQRNRLRRLIRESFRHKRHLLRPLDIVILLQSTDLPEENEKIRQTMDKIWEPLLGL